MPQQDSSGRWLSDDGLWWWDGTKWQPAAPATASFGEDPRALVVSRVLEDSYHLYRNNLGFFVRLVLLSLLLLLISLIVIGAAFGASLLITQGQGGHLPVIVLLVLAVPTWVVAIPVYQVVFYVAAASVLDRTATTARKCVSRAFRLLWPAWLVLLVQLAAALPVLTCIGILLTIWLEVLLSMAIPALAGENAGAGSALSRSAALVKGNWWRVFLVLAVAVVATSIVSQILMSLLTGLVSLAPFKDAGASAASLVATVSIAVLATAAYLVIIVLQTPVAPIVASVTYRHLRSVSEGRGSTLSSPASATPPQLPA